MVSNFVVLKGNFRFQISLARNPWHGEGEASTPGNPALPTEERPQKRCPKLAQWQDTTTGGKFGRIASSLGGIPTHLSGRLGLARLFRGFGVRLRIAWGASNMWRLARAPNMALHDLAKGCAAQIWLGGGQVEKILHSHEILDATSCGQFEP